MSAVKIGPSRQVVIPKHIYDELELAPGDYLEATHRRGKLVFTPKALVDKPLPARLARGEADGARRRRARRTAGKAIDRVEKATDELVDKAHGLTKGR